MEIERRFARWRNPVPATPLTGREILDGFASPTKQILLISLSAAVVLLLFFPYLHVFECLLILLSIPACAIPLGKVYANRHFTGYQDPLPTYVHGDDLQRMNVTLRLEVDGHVYGEDRGEITLVDDWLIFEGARTSFSISRADVDAFLPLVDVEKRTQFALNLRGLGAKIRIRLIGDVPDQHPSLFLANWRSRLAKNVGSGILPPL